MVLNFTKISLLNNFRSHQNWIFISLKSKNSLFFIMHFVWIDKNGTLALLNENEVKQAKHEIKYFWPFFKSP